MSILRYCILDHLYESMWNVLKRFLKRCRGNLTLLGPLQELEGHLVPTGQHRILLQSGQLGSGTPLLLSTRVCVCGPDWMTTMMTQSFLWVACFFQGHSTPTPPMDRSEGDAEWARSAILICCNRRWCVTSLQCRMGQSRARPWKTPFGGW